MDKIISEDQIRSLPTIEELIREELDAKEFNELVEKEESTSLEHKEMIKYVEKTSPKITLWGDEHEKIEKEKITPITEVDETILELIKIGKAAMMKKTLESLRKHASQKYYVLKQLHEHKFRILGKDGGNNHHSICS